MSRNKKKDMFGSIKFLIFLLVLLGAFMIIWQKGILDNGTNSNIDFIAEHYNSSGELIDYFSEIKVSSAEDIKFFVEDKEITIEFGIINLKWSPKDFVKPETQQQLSRIYLEVFKDKETGRLRLFYKGKEVERWVR